MNNATEPSDLLVETRGLGVRFGTQQILRKLHISIPRGQTLAIIGESGCGKTVFLKTLIGLIPPSDGRVLFDGRELTKLSDIERTRQRVRFGFVFQNAALFDSLTVGQNIAFPLREHSQLEDTEVRERVDRLLLEVGLPSSIVSKKPAELSGGMRKRVGVARALALEPEIMLYDEPTTGLDPIMSDVINELMMRTRVGRTSVIVTHDMRTARKVADRVIMLYPLARLDPDASQLIFDGPPSQLDHAQDRRVTQFVMGEAGERLMELREAAS
ncbi:MAG: ATP-binding cassette domain-containing protein [Planctomycetales bacterium]|nr:ATP-binding cassette domain-containing protein [Planctomycetales bacterium]